MNVQTVTAATAADARPALSRFFLPGAKEFAGGLNLGQIIKGKVMRQFEGGGRYLVSFDGRERVVDSTIPLTKGELIHGRVVALGDRVELQRVHPGDTEDAKAARPEDTAARIVPTGQSEQPLSELTARFRTELSSGDHAVLARATRMAGDATAMAMVGIMVNKLGLRQSPELLWPAYRALLREDSSSAALFRGNEAPALQIIDGNAGAAAVASTVRQFADALGRQFNQGDEPKDSQGLPSGSAYAAPVNASEAAIGTAVAAVGQRSEDDSDSRQPARWLLNVQTEGAVAHRIGTVPILVGDSLVEVDLSFFEQRKGRQLANETEHRKVVFSLNTESLGTVEIVANVSGKHLRLRVATGDRDATGGASGYAPELREALASAGWEVDEIVYETRQGDSHNGVVRSVVEHVIAQDSLNQLI